MAKTITRPGMLKLDIIKNNLRFHEKPEISGAIRVVEKLGQIWDGLETVRNVSDPLITREASALRYRDSFNSANTAASREIAAASVNLMDAKTRVRNDALGKAGLLTDYKNSKEILEVLRGMNQAARDAALTKAAKDKDHAVLAAVHGAHPLLVGETSIPLGTLIEEFVASSCPDEAAEIANIIAAEENLDVIWGAFKNSAEKMRDKEGELVGEQGARAAREAEAKLGLAIQNLGQAE